MAVNIVRSKEQIVKELYDGAVCEKRLIGSSQEKYSLPQYSNIYSWTFITSDFGCTTPEFAHLGFDILNFVVSGSLVMFDKSSNYNVQLNRYDFGMLRLGKGLRHSEKVFPRSEVLQIWFNPINKKDSSQIAGIEAKKNSNANYNGGKPELLEGKNSLQQFDSQNLSVEVNDFGPGFHTIKIPSNSVLSCFILAGFVEMNDTTLGKGDFFKVDEITEVRIASLINSRIFMMVSPYVVEYQANKIGNI
jgi:redox-sensitive bicupin YhaK (pirin superfamily)